MKHVFPRAVFERILRDAGADRVSKGAKEELRSHIEALAEEVAKDAIRYTSHYDRTTVMPEDIELALR